MGDPVTLTEYLQNAVTELRRESEAWAMFPGPESEQWRLSWALADHVETMLAEHVPDHYCHDGADCGDKQCGACTYSMWPCPSLRSLAQLVSTVTGIPVPEGTTA